MITQLFDISNVVVLPFWALMIVVPGIALTQRVMASYLPYAALALLYVFLLTGTLTPEAAADMANPTLTNIAHFFSDERAAAVGWVHFLVMDLFVGRWIYQDGLAQSIFTRHSIALCLFAGPLGLLSHIITRAITLWVKRSKGEVEPIEA
jgi:Domain of unknown function (DUF4281)